jgi:hypothetical protein
MYVMLVKEDRKAPATDVPTDAERIELFAGLIAYTETYTIDGDKVNRLICDVQRVTLVFSKADMARRSG